ncbi:MAG: dockerin type I domain-containing protein, partial [Sulfuricella sp.]
TLSLASLDPSRFMNGVYQLRLTAWDLVGRTSEINSRIIIDSTSKDFGTHTASDGTVTLAGHTLALTRTLTPSPFAVAGTPTTPSPLWGEGGGEGNDFGNWSLPLLSSSLTSDQPATLASGATAPWSEGARVWLNIPADLANPNAGLTNLAFTLSTTSERLGTEAGAPIILHPAFTSDQAASAGSGQDWQLQAHNTQDSALSTQDSLTRQGRHLYDQASGLPWVPAAYTLTAADGTRYNLDAHGKITAITFSDGAQWLISDAGIVAVGSGERVAILRDSAGRIARISYPTTTPSPLAGEGRGEGAIAYKYDTQGRLILARKLNDSGLGTPYAYGNQGELLTDTLTANLGAAVNWNTPGNGAWSGTLATGTTTLAYTVRDSEIASTIHTPGAQGALILALETSLPLDATLEVTGAQIIGSASINGLTTTLLRVTEAGVKLIRITGAGDANLRISVAGDLNRDGKIDGTDSQMFEQALASPLPNPLPPAGEGANEFDLTGDGQVNSTDRQVLYANTGWRANQAPVAAAVLPNINTHTDLAKDQALASIAQDFEGDSIFWRVLNATHGVAKLSSDGQTLLFTPETGYAGQAVVRVQADDGFAASAPIELSVNVSGAKLLAIHLAALPQLQAGQSALIKASVDFADEKGVAIVAGDYLTLSAADISGMGFVGTSAIAADDIRDIVRAKAVGPALLTVSRTDTDGRVVRSVAALNVAAASVPVDPAAAEGDDSEGVEPFLVQPDVYPGTLSLIPGGTRQLKVHTLDPNTGEQADISQANPTTTSGTRYYSSDESIATVSESGLITAQGEGRAVITVVYLGSSLDEFGNVIEQSIGQSDITLTVQAAQLTDDDPATVAPQGVEVSKEQGGVVSSDTGEMVLIGTGALASDTVVSIRRIDAQNVQAITGLAPPAAGILETVGAFTLNVGDTSTNHPLQLAIPVQAGISARAGDEVLFFRKGTVLTPDGSYQDTWWLVDNGYVGAEANGSLVARTASPPYTGLDSSGEYLVAKRLPGVIGSMFDLGIGAGDWLSFGGLGFAMGGGLSGINVASEVMGILMTSATTLTAGSYHFGVPQFADIVLPPVPSGETYRVDTSQALPQAVTPYGNVALPNVTNAAVDEANGTIKLTLSNAAPGQFTGKLVVRVLYPDGSYKDVKTLAGDTTGEVTITPPDGIAVSSVSWQIVRLIPTDAFTGSGTLSSGEPLEFAANTVRISAKPDMAVALTRTGIDLYRQDKIVGHTNLLYDNNQSLNLPYLTGGKVQPVVFSEDLSSIFVGGNGVVYVIDSLTFKLINTLTIPSGKNISSLATAGYLLLIGEGQRMGSGVGSRLLAMDIRPGSEDFGKVVSLKNTGIENAPYGVAGMAIGPDGRTLVVATPINPNGFSFSLGDRSKRGDVLVFDLATLDLNTGKIAAAIKAQLPADGFSGKSPQSITATKDPDRFLVAHIADYSKGLSALVITRDADGKITGARMSVIDMSQPGSAIRIDRLNIQRAQSAVLVEQDGVEYAIVSDDNYHFLDPYWKAMYEAPDFLYTPFGPPIAFGGSASAKKVAVGGKLGIVQDPFGKNGVPQFLGATLPLDGYGIVNLSLSEDGKVLIGQLKGGFSANILSSDANTQKPSQSHVWSVEALIAAALAMPDQDRMTKHIKLPPIAEQLIANKTGYVAGTAFDPSIYDVSLKGRMGDVIEVDLQWLMADAMAREELKLSGAEVLPESKMTEDVKAFLKTVRENHLLFGIKDFAVDKADLFAYADDYANGKERLKLITESGASDKPYSREGKDNLVKADFEKTGRMYLAPNITKDDETTLRNGGRITQPKTAELWFSFRAKDEKGEWEWHRGSVNVIAEDYVKGQAVFFGDRPLDNPGYSAFTLKGEVGDKKANDVLDVYRVEQRLKYLGFPAMGATDAGGAPTLAHNVIQDFKVDGKWGRSESLAANLFSDVVEYGPSWRQLTTHTTNRSAYFSGLYSIADSLSISKNGTVDTNAYTGAGGNLLSYLNAYNAPHWMNIGSQMQFQNGVAQTKYSIAGWNNMQVGKTAENYGTSWMRDLMVAKQYAPSALVQSQSWFNGGVDANQGYTPFTHSTHDLGMAFDLGVSNYINKFGAQLAYQEPLAAAISALPGVSWSVDATYNYSGNLTNSTDPRNNQRAALRDFLSLYALTRSDGIVGNGTWDDLPVKNGAAVRTALFGSGVKAGALISEVYIGGKPTYMKNGSTIHENPYRNINTILGKLDIKSSNVQVHQSHFHIYLQPPNATPITQHLLADAQSASSADTTVSNATLQTDTQALLAYAQSIIDTGEEIMFTMDVPYVPVQETPTLLAQATTPNTGSNTQQPDYLLKVCDEVPSEGDLTTAMNVVDPAGWLAVQLGNRSGRYIEPGTVATIKHTLLEGTTHGKLIPKVTGSGIAYFMYEPEPGYVGKDRAIFMADFEGKRYKLVIDLKVSTFVDEKSPVCPQPRLIKVKKPISGSSTYDLNSKSVTFAGLDGGALAQATGTTITLDTTAAGHNWFIDSTPADNSEYLPTSNPNEWVAKAGSAAAGKMDLLSVLLHEYGHALGIAHSANPNDYMAATLQPGVRRLPSSEELALMAQLVGEIKTSQDSTPNTPINPSLPIGTTLSALLLGRLRRTNYGSWSPVFDSVQIPA